MLQFDSISALRLNGLIFLLKMRICLKQNNIRAEKTHLKLREEKSALRVEGRIQSGFKNHEYKVRA